MTNNFFEEGVQKQMFNKTWELLSTLIKQIEGSISAHLFRYGLINK